MRRSSWSMALALAIVSTLPAPADAASRPRRFAAAAHNRIELRNARDGRVMQELEWGGVSFDVAPDGSTVYFFARPRHRANRRFAAKHPCRETLYRTNIESTFLVRGEMFLAGGYAPSISPDGSRLAFVRSYNCSPTYLPQIVVLDLKSVEKSVWSLSGGSNPIVEAVIARAGEAYTGWLGPTQVNDISWASDSRHLAYDLEYGDRSGHSSEATTEVWILDTSDVSSPGRQLSPSASGAVWSTPAYRGRWGTLAVVESCCPDYLCCYFGRPESARIVSVDPASGQVIAPLVHVPRMGLSALDFDATGRHMLLTTHYEWVCDGRRPARCERNADRTYRWSGNDLVYLGRSLIGARW